MSPIVKKAAAWSGAITSIAAAGVLIWQAYNHAPVPDSVEEWHEEASQKTQAQVDEIHGLVTALTIPALIGIVRDNPCNYDMRNLLVDRLATYEEKIGRQYSNGQLPPCEEGSVPAD